MPEGAARDGTEAVVDVVRGEVVESRHRVVVAVVSADGTLRHAWGDASLVTYLRSAAKPFQALPFVLEGAADAFGATPAELALVAGSHNGEPKHTGPVGALLGRVGLDEGALRCGTHPPFHKPTAKALGDAFTQIHHNCSGKHAGMLATCVHRGWDTDGYLDPAHPVQRRVLDSVAWACGLSRDDVAVGVDGCGVPSFAVPLWAAGRAFARLATADAEGEAREAALARVRAAMRSHPDLVAGDDRIDTKVARATGGNVIVKAGAEACYGAALVEEGLGVVVKVVDGASRAVGPVFGAVLERLRVLDPGVASGLADEFAPVLTNHAGRGVGRVVARLPEPMPRQTF